MRSALRAGTANTNVRKGEGTSQTDAAFLTAEDINCHQRTICYGRQKLASQESCTVKPALIRFGQEVAYWGRG